MKLLIAHLLMVMASVSPTIGFLSGRPMALCASKYGSLSSECHLQEEGSLESNGDEENMDSNTKERTQHRHTQTQSADCNNRRRFFMESLVVVGGGSAVATFTAPSLVMAAHAAVAAEAEPAMVLPSQHAPKNKRMGGLASKIRVITRIMDELQRDLMQERWDLVEAYPGQLRSFVSLLTTYTDSAFPSDAPTDKGLRVALRYEVGRFFASLERFKGTVQRQSLEDAYIAYSEMSLHLDRYLRVGGLYTYYDSTISNEPYFEGIKNDALVYADQKKDPPLVRDLIVIISGPDKGKTGIVIGMYADGSNKTAIKLDRYKGMREIRVVPNTWVAKRVGEQDPDDVFLLPRTGKQ